MHRGEISTLVEAREHLRWAASYVQKHGVKEFEKEASLAVELAELLTEKLTLVQRLADS